MSTGRCVGILFRVHSAWGCWGCLRKADDGHELRQEMFLNLCMRLKRACCSSKHTIAQTESHANNRTSHSISYNKQTPVCSLRRTIRTPTTFFLFRNPSRQAQPRVTVSSRLHHNEQDLALRHHCPVSAKHTPIHTTDHSLLRTYVPSNPMLGSTAQTLAAQGRRQGRLRYAHHQCDKSMR